MRPLRCPAVKTVVQTLVLISELLRHGSNIQLRPVGGVPRVIRDLVSCSVSLRFLDSLANFWFVVVRTELIDIGFEFRFAGRVNLET
jgi:hypothetical protein